MSDKNKPLLTALSIIIIVEMGLYCAYFVETWRSKYFESLTNGAPFAIQITLLVVQITTEIVLCGSLLYLLYQSRTGFKASNSIIKRIIALTMGTSLITIFFGLADVFTVYGESSSALNEKLLADSPIIARSYRIVSHGSP